MGALKQRDLREELQHHQPTPNQAHLLRGPSYSPRSRAL